MPNSTVAGTGHRPNNIWIGTQSAYEPPVYARLVALARAALDMRHPTHVLTGMALGWDQALATAARDVGIPYSAYIPFPGQDGEWPIESRRAYHGLLATATDIVTVVPWIDEWCINEAFQKRNEALVDAADWVLALWNGVPKGGTARCIAYALAQEKRVENLWHSWVKHCG